MDEKIVASSAIEYYPDDLRRHYAQQSSSAPTTKEKGMKERRGKKGTKRGKGRGMKRAERPLQMG